MSESYWEEEASSLEIQLSELQEKYDELKQQKEELREFISSKLSEAWSKMGDTGSSDYMSKLPVHSLGL